MQRAPVVALRLIDLPAAPRYDYLAMADPTLADVMAQLASVQQHLTRLDLQQQQQTGLLIALTNGVQIMTATADQTKTAVDSLDAKVDQFLAAVQPVVTTLQQALAAAQAQIAALQAGDAAVATTLGATVDSAAAETAKVQAAIDALTPPAPAPVTP